MEETTLDETESVPKRGTKCRRSSILKQRTPLQVIEPNPRRVSFSVKQTKEFHSTEAPFVLGSSYEETFQADSPKSTQESHFSMKMVHSSTTSETYSDRGNEANLLLWHEELLNTTHVVNIDDFETSEGECEARVSIDIQQAETQHYGLGVEEITHNRQESINWNEQMENIENLTPEVLNHLMKKKAQASQVTYQSGNRSLLDYETEKKVNISGHDTSNTKANVWQHHSSQTFIECLFPSSHIIRNDGIWNNKLSITLNRSEKEIFRGASPLTQLDKGTVHINNDKFTMDADMDFTDVIHANKTSSGSNTSHVKNMDLTKGIFCSEKKSSSDEVQYGDLDESEIEFTNTVGHIAVSESENTSSKILELKTMKGDNGNISDSLNAQEVSTKYVHKTTAHHLQPSNETMQITAEFAGAVDSSKIHTMVATASEEKKRLLEKSEVFPMYLDEKNKEDLNCRTLEVIHGCHAEFINATSFRTIEDTSRTNKMNESNSKSITSTSNINCTELTNASLQKLVSDISQSSQMENVHIKENKSAAKISDDSHIDLNGAVRCNSSTKHIDDRHLELTNASVCKPLLLIDNVFNNKQINNDPANDSQLEFTNRFHCKSVAEVSNNDMEFTDVTNFKIAVKVTDDSDKELTEVGDRVDANLYEINLEYKNSNTGKMNSSKVECLDIVHKSLTEDTNLKSDQNSHHRQEQSKFLSYNPLSDTFTDVWTKLTYVNCKPASESYNDSHLEFTNTSTFKPVETVGTSCSKESSCHYSEQTEKRQQELNGLKSSDSSLEFTKIVRHKSSIEDANNSALEFINIIGQNEIRKIVEHTEEFQMELSDLKSSDSSLEFTKPIKHKSCAEDSNNGLEFKSITEEDPARKNAEQAEECLLELSGLKSSNSSLEFTKPVKPKSSIEDSNNGLQFKSITEEDPARKNAEQVEECLLELSGLKSSDSSLEFTKPVKPKSSIEDSNNGLEFRNITEKNQARKNTKQAEECQMELSGFKSSDSSLEFTKTVKHKSSIENANDSGLEFTNIIGQNLIRKNNEQVEECQLELSGLKSSEGSLEFTKIVKDKSIEDSNNSGLEFTNITGQNQVRKTRESRLQSVSDVVQNLHAKDSDDSQLEFTSITGQKLLTKDIGVSQLGITDISRQNLKYTNFIMQNVPAKDSDSSQLEFTNNTGKKLTAEDSYSSQQLELVNISHKQAAKVVSVSQMEITDIISQKPATEHSDVQMEITDITTQKPATNHSDDSQLEFTSLTMQKPSTKDSDDNWLEFTNNTSQKLPMKDSDNNQVIFTNSTLQKSLAEDSVDSGLEFTDSAKHKLAAKYNVDVSQLEFTNTAGQKLLTKHTENNQLEISSLTMEKLCTKDFDDSHLQYINNARQKLPVKTSSDSHLELIYNTSNKSFTNNSDYQPELTNVITDKFSAKEPDESQLEFTDNIRQKMLKDDSDNCMDFTNKTREKLPEKDFDDSRLEFTNIIGHNTATKDSNGSQLVFTGTAECMPSIKNSTNVLDCAAYKHTTNVFDANNCSKEIEDIDTVSNESIYHFRSQLELTEVVPLKPETNIRINLSCSKERDELNQFSLRTADGNCLELTNVVGIKPMMESCESKTVIIDAESAKAVEDTCAESTVVMDLTNAIQCRKNPKNRMELTDIGCHPEYFTKCSSVERKENIHRSIDITELGLSFSPNRKRNINNLSCDHSEDCELECSNMKYFRSAEEADAQITIGTKTEISETASSKCFIERHLDLTARTEVEKASLQHIDTMPCHASQIDLSRTLSCGTIKSSLEYIPEAFEVPRMNLDEFRNNDSMEFTNKQNYNSQTLNNMEFTACIKDVSDASKDVLQAKPHLPSHPKGTETDNSEPEISLGSNLPQSIATANMIQDDLTHAIAVTDLNISPKKKEIRNEAYSATYLPLTSDRKQKQVQKKMQAVQKLLEVTIGSDEAFMFESCTGSIMPIDKLQMNKQLEYVDKTHSYPIQLDIDSENTIYKTREEDKENQKQSIEYIQSKDVDLHFEPRHVLALEDELVTLGDKSNYDLESEDEVGESLMKIILDADRSLFSSLSTASPGTVLSSNSECATTANKEHLMDKMHPNLINNKESMSSNESEMISEVEGSSADGQLPKIHVLNQTSGISETKMEMCNLSVDMDLLSVSDIDMGSVGQAEVFTVFSNNSRETKEKIADVEALSKEEETFQLPNISLACIESSCRDSAVQDKAKKFKTAAVLKVDKSCVAAVQKPLSLEEWLRSKKHEWDVKELDDTQWNFLFLYKSLGLVLKFDTANVQDGMKHISDILLESYLAKKSAPETHFVHHILLKKLSPQNLKTKFRVTADVPELMNTISKAVSEMRLFLKDFFFMETCKLMEMKDYRVSFKMSDMHIHSVFRVSVDLNNWENIKPEDVTVEDLMGTINKKEVQSLVNAVPKGPTFLSEYVNIIREYISVLRKK